MYDPLDINDMLELPMSNRQRKRIKRDNNKKNRQSRQSKTNNNESRPRDGGLVLKNIQPKTYVQSQTFDAYDEDYHLLLHGYPGTGKTFLACYLAIKDLLENGNHEKIVIVRSALATRDIGFLPGSKDEKIAEYEAPYIDIFGKLFGRGDAYKILKTKNLVEFIPTSFIRGITLDNCIVIVDEMSNLTLHENSSIITRLGDNTRIIFCGDFRQSDHRFKDEKEGVLAFLDVIREMKSFAPIEFGADDIVRSDLVKEFILTAIKKGIM